MAACSSTLEPAWKGKRNENEAQRHRSRGYPCDTRPRLLQGITRGSVSTMSMCTPEQTRQSHDLQAICATDASTGGGGILHPSIVVRMSEARIVGSSRVWSAQTIPPKPIRTSRALPSSPLREARPHYRSKTGLTSCICHHWPQHAAPKKHAFIVSSPTRCQM